MMFFRWVCMALTLCSSESKRRDKKAMDNTTLGFVNDDNITEISLAFVKALNTIDSVDQFLRDFVDPRTIPPQPLKLVSAGFGGFGGFRNQERRSTFRTPKFANCEPEMQTIKLTNENEGNIFYYPSCTRVLRCGGCCSHDLLACRPVTIEQLQFSVLVTEYRGGRSNRALTYKGRDLITVEQHTKCRCECRVQPEDCSPIQTYDSNACRCTCKNKEAEEKCKDQSEKKLWSSKDCSCVCRNILECSTGFTFDPFSCQCVELRRTSTNRNIANEEDSFSTTEQSKNEDNNRNMNRYNYNVDITT